MAIATSTNVSIRLPNSIAECTSSAPCGVNDRSVHRGQVGQPSPEPVRRTAPPVTTSTMLATSVAQRERPQPGVEAGQAHSHLNVLAVRTVPSAAHRAVRRGRARRSRRRSAPPASRRRARPTGARPTNSPKAPYADDGQHHRAPGHEQQVDQVRRRQRRLGAEHAGEEQAERGERGGAGDDREHGADARPGRGPSRARTPPARARRPAAPRPPAGRTDLPGEQPGSRQRGGAESLDHAVPTLEAGRDRQRGEGGRHHRQRQHARGEDVDGGVGEVEVERVRRRRRHRPARSPGSRWRAAAARRCAASAATPSGPGPRPGGPAAPRRACGEKVPVVMASAPVRSAGGRRPRGCAGPGSATRAGRRTPRTTATPWPACWRRPGR